jgi:hypothetical protein
MLHVKNPPSKTLAGKQQGSTVDGHFSRADNTPRRGQHSPLPSLRQALTSLCVCVCFVCVCRDLTHGLLEPKTLSPVP